MRPRKKARNANRKNKKDRCNSLKENDLSEKKVGEEDSGERSEEAGDCWVSRALHHVISVDTEKETVTMISQDPGHLNIFNSERHIEYNQHLSDNCQLSPRRSKHKQISKQLSQLKRKIEHLENTFTEKAGYRPSQADKRTDPEMNSLVIEQARLRREVKNIKENFEMKGEVKEVSKSTEKVNRSIDDIKHSLSGIELKLEDNRKVKDRPFDLDLMTIEEIIDEKLDIQSLLLDFEKNHGHPETKDEKEAMKGLYDRYRSLKMLVNRSNSARSRQTWSDLVPIPEDSSLPLTLASPPHRLVLALSSPGRTLPVSRHDMDLPRGHVDNRDLDTWHSLPRYGQYDS